MIINLFSIFDPSTSRVTQYNWIVVGIPVIVLPLGYWVVYSRRVKRIIKGSIYCFEEIKAVLGKERYVILRCVGLIGFISVNNIIGLIPYVFRGSSHLRFRLRLALPCWVGVIIYGWYNNTTRILGHLIPIGTPQMLIPFIVLIERVSIIIRPVTLRVRLAANILAGHLLIVLISSSCVNRGSIFKVVTVFRLGFLVLLELAVRVIQAYVLVVLVRLYIKESRD